MFSLNAQDDKLSFDLSDDWGMLENRYDINECISFCILEDIAENIFLTISLRDRFKDLHIVALAKDKESAYKLDLAGASRVIPLAQTVANIIVEMLEKPRITQLLHSILYEKSNLQIEQIKIKTNDDMALADSCGVLVLFVVHDDMTKDFIYSSKVKRHDIVDGDSIIVVGETDNITDFLHNLDISHKSTEGENYV